MAEDIITPDVIESWWAAISATLAALGGSAVLARQWWIARKAAQLALLVVQLLGRSYVDRWKGENVDGKLTIDQREWTSNQAAANLEALVEKESSAVQKYVKKKTPAALVESAVKVRKMLKEKRRAKTERKIGPKGGIR